MAEPPVENPASADEDAGELRSQLLRRLAVAGVLVALLLGVLALFDYLSNPPDDDDSPVFSKPVPVPPRKEVSQPVKPATDLPEPPPVAVVPAEPPPMPEVAAAPAPVAPVTPAASAAAERPEIRPNSASTAVATKPVPATPAPVAVVTRPVPRAVPEVTEAPPMAPPPARSVEQSPAEPAKPSARVVESRPAPVAAPQAPRLFSGFVLQAGVFSSMQRAEELHARLALSGVPSSVETRVQVGPFRTRQEAELAQQKLREQGIETVLVAPKGASR